MLSIHHSEKKYIYNFKKSRKIYQYKVLYKDKYFKIIIATLQNTCFDGQCE